MRTEDLIATLAADARPHKPAVGIVTWLALLAAAVTAVVGWQLVMGEPRALTRLLTNGQLAFKVAIMVVVAASGFVLLLEASYPEPVRRRLWTLLWLGPALLALGVAAELLLLPADRWLVTAVGRNAVTCLSVVPQVAAVPLAILLAALHFGAPSRPATSGLLAGVVAGGLGSALYAINCPDNSPLFVLTWYPIAIGGMALLGAVLGSRLLRW